MLSKIPIVLENLTDKEKDKEILRMGMIAELDAVNLYEQLAAATNNERIKKVLLDIAREEKTHIGEFETLLHEIDEEQVEENKKAKEEIEELS